MYKLSVVIPCHNESKNLPYLIAEIAESMNRNDVEVVLVNDGSVDDTMEILQRVAEDIPFVTVVNSSANRGYGGAIILGLESARGTYIGWMHGDLQTPFKDVLAGLSKIEFRGEPENIYVKGLRKGRRLSDQFFTLGMSMLESFLLRRRMFDINAQPNLFHRNFFSSWKNPPLDFSLDLYALYTARSRGLEVVRIPVIFPPRRHGHSHWNFGFMSKMKLVARTVRYSVGLKRRTNLPDGV